MIEDTAITEQTTAPPRGKAILDLVTSSLDDDKAENIVVVELAGKTDIAYFMVIASGQSRRQIGAMAEHLTAKLKRGGAKPGVEGLTLCDWVLLDAGDVIVHLFRSEVRGVYNLEKMWSVPMVDSETSDELIA